MKVIIVGAGEVGTSIAADLVDTHEVVIIESDKEKVEDLTYSTDGLSIQGDGTQLETLRSADIEIADMLVACTNDDTANIVICEMAKAVSDAFTIARTKHQHFLETWQNVHGVFDVDFMVCSNLLTAEAIFRISGLSGAHDVESFANGHIQMAEFEIHEKHDIVGQTINEANRAGSLTFSAIFRKGEVHIPSGDTIIQEEDRIVVIGSTSDIRSFAEESKKGHKADNVVILGGGEIGYQTAKLFADHGYKPRLIEENHERAQEIAESLPNVRVMENDTTDIEFLSREHIDNADVVIATLPSDEMNLLSTLLAKQLGVERTITLAKKSEYASLFEAVGIDVAVNPLIETAEEIAEEVIHFTRNNKTKKIAMLEQDVAEVLEIEVDTDSVLVNQKIADVTSEFSNKFIIGAIERSGDVISPHNETVIQPADHIVALVDTTALEEVLKII